MYYLLRFEAGLIMFSMSHHPQFLADLTSQYNPPIPHNHMFLLRRVGKVVWWDDEVSFDVVFSKILMSFRAVSVLNLIVSVEIHQCLWCYVDSSKNEN